jgi:hypothetical protein
MRHRHVADLFFGRQECLHRHRVGGLAHPYQLAAHLEDLAVQRLEEMARLQEIRDPVEGVVVDQDRAEQSLFGLDIVRRLAVERRFRRAELADCFCHRVPVKIPRASR